MTSGDLSLLACLLDPRSKPMIDRPVAALGFTAVNKSQAYRLLENYLGMLNPGNAAPAGETPGPPAALPQTQAPVPKPQSANSAALDGMNATLRGLAAVPSVVPAQPHGGFHAPRFSRLVNIYKEYSCDCDLDWVRPRIPTQQELTSGGVIDILSWWKVIGCSLFPAIAEVARIILAIPATSAPSERVFSTAGRTSCGDRASMKPDTVERLTMAHENNRRRPTVFSFRVDGGGD